MPYGEEDWKRLATVVKAARQARGYGTTKAWVEAAGKSDRQLLGLERGEAKGEATLSAIEDALEWPRGWAYRVLSGQVRGPYVRTPPRALSPEGADVERLVLRLQELAHETNEISLQLLAYVDIKESNNEPAKTQAVDTPTAAPPDYALASNEGIVEVNFPRHAQDADAEAPQVSPDDH